MSCVALSLRCISSTQGHFSFVFPHFRVSLLEVYKLGSMCTTIDGVGTGCEVVGKVEARRGGGPEDVGWA